MCIRHGLKSIEPITLPCIWIIFDIGLREETNLLALSDLFQQSVDFILFDIDSSLLLLLLRLTRVNRHLCVINEPSIKIVSECLPLRSKSLMELR